MPDEKETPVRDNISPREFISNDLADSLAKKSEKEPLPILDWIDMWVSNPELGQLSHSRMHQIIKSGGYEEVNHKNDPRRAAIFGLEPRESLRIPSLFKNFKGIEDVVIDLDNYFYLAAGQGEASRQILMMYGPPGGGKSTLAEIIRKTLENHGFWQLENCNHHDNPIDIIPRHLRKQLLDRYGLHIDPRADICAQCRKKLLNDYGEDYTRFKVEWRNFSQRRGCGIAVVSEVDPINFNMAVLIGEEDISLLGKHKRGDPDTLSMTGAFSRGKRGVVEQVEIFKNPIEALRPLITLTQERYVPLPKFIGQVYVDTVVIGHCNEAEWTRFLNEPTNEAIEDRIWVVRVPYNLRLTEEIQIYRDSFLGKSLKFKNVHIDPHALEQVALFALSTRLSASQKVDLLTKMRIYDGQDITKHNTTNISLSELREEADRREGLVGLSYRKAVKDIIERCLASTRHRWEKDPTLKDRGYLNPLWIRRELIRYVKRTDILKDGDWPKASKKRWLAFIQNDLHGEFMKRLEEDLMTAYSVGSPNLIENMAESLFNNYLTNIVCYHMGVTFNNEVLESIEKHLTFSSDAEAAAFRKELALAAFELRSRNEKYDWKSNTFLRYGIEREIRQPILREIITAIQGGSERSRLTEEMMKLGYAKMGARVILNYAINHLGRD